MTTIKNHPYLTLEDKAFWKLAIAHRKTAEISQIWQPQFNITQSTRFATVGSCFAQHISRWLKNNDYVWLDSEPSPSEASEADSIKDGYGIFSFRTGNIYTAALFYQWIRWAVNGCDTNEYWENNGRYYDPFRPTIPENGYTSAQEMLDARRFTLKCIAETLKNTDVLVLTLGLTEAWQNNEGYFYPMCPGTLHGSFDETKHHFVNLDYDATLHYLNAAFDLIKTIHPDIQFLLTVSPVPLTATASGDHVLPATTYSKSVLRAVAGVMQKSRQDVDYFPSYELITGPQSKGKYYSDNLRSVTDEGVQYVMHHFSAALNNHPLPLQPNEAPVLSHTPPSELICEEVMLEKWAGTHVTNNMSLCLLGDSHMGFLSAALRKKGIEHAGGMVMNGSAWSRNAFAMDQEEIFVPLENALSRSRWQETLPFFKHKTPEQTASSLIITNIGMQSHMNTQGLYKWGKEFVKTNELDIPILVEYYKRLSSKHLTLLKQFIDRGYKVLFIGDPPVQARRPANLPLMETYDVYEKIACHVMQETGCEALSPKEYLISDEVPPSHYYSNLLDKHGEPDWIHGSEDYYDQLAALIINIYFNNN